jgi:predicted dehydrogenase
MINIALIGCGYWGPNLLRNFQDHNEANVARVIDLDDERLAYVADKYPSIDCSKDYHDAFKSDVDAVIIATQPSNHYQLAKEALEQGKHVLVEKPLAMTLDHAKELVQLAHTRERILMVGHTFEYNEAVRALKTEIDRGTIGKPYYFYAQRLNFGIVRQDVSSLWNLAPHDISILNYLMGAMPERVSAQGFDFIQPGLEDVIFMVLHYPDNVKAHVQVSWLDPRKVRSMTVVGSEKMIVYDDMADNKIQIFDKGIKRQNIDDSLGSYDDFGKYQLIKQAGDVTFPKIDFGEPLRNECNEFIESITTKKQPLTDGLNGLRVVAVLEAADRSVKASGREMVIEKVDITQMRSIKSL